MRKFFYLWVFFVMMFVLLGLGLVGIDIKTNPWLPKVVPYWHWGDYFCVHGFTALYLNHILWWTGAVGVAAVLTAILSMDFRKDDDISFRARVIRR